MFGLHVSMVLDSQDDKTIAHHTVNLLTSTLKVDAEQSDLRFCFRIISPSKTFTLQVHLCPSVIQSEPMHLSMLSDCQGSLMLIFPFAACLSRQKMQSIEWTGWTKLLG